MTRRRVLVVTESRATYGYVRRLLRLIRASPALELRVVVTGMHLLKEFGSSVREVEADGVPIDARVDMMVGGDTPAAWSKSLGLGITGLAQAYDQIMPDIVLVAGDRGEVLAATVAAAYMGIPVAHIQSGDLSGHIDGSARHAITKLAHIHLPSCADSAQRVLRLGEEPWRIHDVGAPQLDEIVQAPRMRVDELSRMLGLDLQEKTLLVIQHATLVEAPHAYDQMTETMEAIKALGMPTIVIYPNNDAGGQEVIRAIKQYEGLANLRTFSNIERRAFMSLLGHVACLVGNSSCGILEAPSFQLPAVNVGDRQAQRMRAVNVLDVPHDRARIEAAVRHALKDDAFRETLRSCTNPYGDGHSSERIVRILETVELGPRLLEKRMTY